MRSPIDQLDLPQLEMSGKALLDLSSLTDLEVWLVEQGQWAIADSPRTT
jgi:hypothetical protein